MLHQSDSFMGAWLSSCRRPTEIAIYAAVPHHEPEIDEAKTKPSPLPETRMRRALYMVRSPPGTPCMQYMTTGHIELGKRGQLAVCDAIIWDYIIPILDSKEGVLRLDCDLLPTIPSALMQVRRQDQPKFALSSRQMAWCYDHFGSIRFRIPFPVVRYTIDPIHSDPTKSMVRIAIDTRTLPTEVRSALLDMYRQLKFVIDEHAVQYPKSAIWISRLHWTFPPPSLENTTDRKILAGYYDRPDVKCVAAQRFTFQTGGDLGDVMVLSRRTALHPPPSLICMNPGQSHPAMPFVGQVEWVDFSLEFQQSAGDDRVIFVVLRGMKLL